MDDTQAARDFERWMRDPEFAGAYELARRSLATDDHTKECDCRTCECYEPCEPDSSLCLGCEHNAHPGEVE